MNDEFLIEVNNVSKLFGETAAVDGLNLQVRPGEMVGLVGPDGAGKTTAMRLLCGALQPSSGSMRVRSELASSMNFCAWSRLFQKLSAAIRALSSPSRLCAPGTSKKPPQVGELLRGGVQLGFDDFKHGEQGYRRRGKEARRENAR